MHDGLGDRPAAVARELTKLYEETRRDSLSALAAYYADKPPRGEIVIIVGPPDKQGTPASCHKELTAALAKGHSPRQAAILVAGQTGLPKRLVYARAIELANRQLLTAPGTTKTQQRPKVTNGK